MVNMNRRLFLGQSLYGAAALSLGADTLSMALSGDKSSQPTTNSKQSPSAQKQVDYRTAVVKKYPEQVIVTIAKDKNGKPNPMTMGWTMITSGRPPMMAVSMGHTRYTNAAIKHSKSFTIAFPSAEQADHVLYFGRNSGRNVDKFVETGCRNEPAKEIDCVLLTDAVANFECRLEDQFVTGDHTIFVGRIVASHINAAPKRRLYIVGPGAQLGPVKSGV